MPLVPKGYKLKYNDFEFFGAGWDENQFKSYKGKVDNKYEILKKITQNIKSS